MLLVASPQLKEYFIHAINKMQKNLLPFVEYSSQQRPSAILLIILRSYPDSKNIDLYMLRIRKYPSKYPVSLGSLQTGVKKWDAIILAS